MTLESPPSNNPPREDTPTTSQTEGIPRRRLRGKTQLAPSSLAPSQACPADSHDSIGSQSSEGRPEPYGCWDELYDVLRRPVLDSHIPRELKTLWQHFVMQLLTLDQSWTDVYPIASDLVFILPKLVLSHPPGKEKARDRLQQIQQCLQQASQGEWKYLIDRVLELPVPRYEQDESQPLVTGADSVPPRTAKRLYKAASQGQLGKAWRQLRAPPPVFVGPAQWEEAAAKLTPHAKQEGTVPLREDIAPERWHPTPREYNHAISKRKRNKAADAGGWTTETAQSCMDHPHLKQVLLDWIHTHTRHCYLRPRPADRTMAHPPTSLFRQGRGGHSTHPHWHDMGQTPEPPTSATGQVRLGSLSPGQAIRDWPPQGGLAMTTALKAHLKQHPTHVVACLDFKNAFGSIDRTTVLRELCPQNPAWLDAVNVLLSEPVLVVNPARNHMAMTYDGLPQGDPLSTLVFSLSMTEVLHKAVRATTSEVMTLSYIDDTVLVGPGR